MEKLTIRNGETVSEYRQRLLKKSSSPEYRAKMRKEEFIEDWKNGRISGAKRIGKKSPGAKFHSPER